LFIVAHNSKRRPNQRNWTAIAKSRRNQEFFIVRVEVKSGPKTGNEVNRIEIDTVNEGETSLHESVKGRMAKVLGDLFTHPVPKTFDGVEVRAIAWQGCEGEVQVSGKGLNTLVSVIGSAVPDEHDRTIDRTDPLLQLVEKEKGFIAIALLILPNHASTAAEIIGPIPVDTVRERRTVADAPGTPAQRRPGVSQVHFPVNVGFVHIEQQHFLFANLTEQGLKLRHVSGTFFGVGSPQHFLAFLPTQFALVQDFPQKATAHFTLEDCFDPAAYFLHRPSCPR